MTIQELSTLGESQIKDVLSLISELTSNVTVKPEVLRKTVASPYCHFFAIVEDNDCIIGCATLCVYNSPTGQKASLEDVVVSSQYRGQGLGMLLVKRVIEYAKRELRDVDIHLTSRPFRVAANMLYQKMGFEKRETNAYEMRIRKGD